MNIPVYGYILLLFLPVAYALIGWAVALYVLWKYGELVFLIAFLVWVFALVGAAWVVGEVSK